MPMNRFCNILQMSFVFRISLLFAICMGCPVALAQSDSVLSKQMAIQKLIDDEDLSDEDFEKLLRQQGEIGEKLVALRDYLRADETNKIAKYKESEHLENVISYHFAEYLAGKEQEKHQRTIVQLDRKFKIYQEDDLLINILHYVHTIQNKPKFDSDLLVGSHLKNLRYLNLYAN